jgi:predicted 3-demethylubiquinone-9 3-methyltransferase (glyoxalase superfamily)
MGNSDDTKNHTIFVVHGSSRRSRQVLYLDLQGLEDKNDRALRGRGTGTESSVMTVGFEIEGQEFVALNGGPVFKFTPAISFVINCDTQEEVDRFWDQLSAGGKTDRCGWLTDKFGLSWQVVPKALVALIGDPDAAKSKRVVEAMLQMTKIDIQTLKKAAGA